MLKLFYITNNPEVAAVAQEAGVDRIFIDMEYIGKDERQPNMDTVKNHHTVDDVRAVRRVLDTSQLLVRVNPINTGSAEEINAVIDAGVDIIMLPMWKSVGEVERFFDIVNGRCKTILLLETDCALNCIDDVLKLDCLDEIHIGLNDLHLCLGKKFLFELFVDGTVDFLAKKFRDKNITFGIGGVGRVFQGDLLPAENIIAEHYRLGSSMAILSRAFCNTDKITDIAQIRSIFTQGIKDNKDFEKTLQNASPEYLSSLHLQTQKIIEDIVKDKK